MNALEQSICPPCRAPPPLRLCEFGIYDATDGAPTSLRALSSLQSRLHLHGRLAGGGEDYALWVCARIMRYCGLCFIWVCVNLGAAASCILFGTIMIRKTKYVRA